ncbi:M56 family metallopeptidase [Sinomicrobium soli]|uniref:M56 family metallopeptidase n=1 Tax=Sinomicrobium sp. N-1-3-6 TaxID=2219864 RepID=UPI000DCF1BF6|nr:M56 family metallopeptidase [Sinomicrobium sp. N-1-3-6]RAV30918.1 energy transducer TonB [Sinomicrobium sp. N-1-3-6]
MIHYLLQTVAFQLFFLMVYDLFLKKETFFNWNRLYLWATPLLACVIPFIRIERLGKVMPQEYVVMLPEVIVGPGTDRVGEAEVVAAVPLWQWILFAGMVLSLVLFAVKITRIFRLRRRGRIIRKQTHEEVVLPDSNTAFSFFRSIYLGDRVYRKNHRHIIAHELVHIRQKHTVDLLFFELLRVLFWFNPLVYVFQGRMAELHEFIADAKTTGPDKRESYSLLLQEVFKTEKISFVNPFFKSSLIKKRIIMLQKAKSRKIWQFKYLVLVPLVLGMLVYSSCEREEAVPSTEEVSIAEQVRRLKSAIAEKDNMTEEEIEQLMDLNEMVIIGYGGKAGTPLEDKYPALESPSSGPGVPFGEVEQVPVFPGCENADNPRECFQEKMREHIRKHFRYPEQAQKENIQGRVAIMFTIDTGGNITDIRKRGPSPYLENEAVRIIEKLPVMAPGRSGGKVVNVPFSIPITFRLQSGIDTEQTKSRSGVKKSEDRGKVFSSRQPGGEAGYVYGVVRDSDGNNIPGVNISVRGTERGTITDFDGNYKIGARRGETLRVSYIGLDDVEFKVGDHNNYKVVM